MSHYQQVSILNVHGIYPRHRSTERWASSGSQYYSPSYPVVRLPVCNTSRPGCDRICPWNILSFSLGSSGLYPFHRLCNLLWIVSGLLFQASAESLGTGVFVSFFFDDFPRASGCDDLRRAWRRHRMALYRSAIFLFLATVAGVSHWHRAIFQLLGNVCDQERSRPGLAAIIGGFLIDLDGANSDYIKL